MREEVESKVTAYGRWLLDAVFQGDSAAALENRARNPVWRELLRRAGGPTLRISSRILYVSLHLAARDKRITDQTWRGLDTGRKELLLPLGDDARLREGAKHVTRYNLSQGKVREYVAGVLAAGGRERRIRITVPRLVDRVRRLHASIGGADVARKVGDARGKLTPQERVQAAEALDELRSVLGELARTLRNK
jgi:hypothetical protein